MNFFFSGSVKLNLSSSISLIKRLTSNGEIPKIHAINYILESRGPASKRFEPKLVLALLIIICYTKSSRPNTMKKIGFLKGFRVLKMFFSSATTILQLS